MKNKRAIFKDVESSATLEDAIPRKGIIGGYGGSRKWNGIWLGILLLQVVGTVVLGGFTRLADAGLAITEWNPVMGALPPLNSNAWEVEFSKYREIPEYLLQNKGIELSEFKTLYWWEWSHRQFARLAGVTWLVGFAWFLALRKIPRGWTMRLLVVGALGGFQALVGWWMVSSGLQGRAVDVASYRLALHLSLAFGIIGLLYWYILALLRKESDLLQSRRSGDNKAIFLSSALIWLFLFQIILGALVAGIDAGRGFPTWPLMNGEFLPSEAFSYRPLWTNIFENPALAQFNHRLVGYVLLLFAGMSWFILRNSPYRSIRRSFGWVAALAFAQVAIGIAAAVSGAAISVAVLHQVAAIAILLLIVQARFSGVYPKMNSLREGAR